MCKFGGMTPPRSCTKMPWKDARFTWMFLKGESWDVACHSFILGSLISEFEEGPELRHPSWFGSKVPSVHYSSCKLLDMVVQHPSQMYHENGGQ